MHATNPFDKKWVNKILSKIEFGSNLTEDQLEHIKALICEFANQCLHPVNVRNHTHGLAPSPSEHQPWLEVTQKEWYYRIIDKMESAHVIQKVPGKFIGYLNSMNLAPKEAGNMGTTWVEILSNQQVRSADYLWMQLVTTCNDTCIRGD